MVDTQEEKIKKIFAAKGIKIQEVVDKLFPNAKGSYYNRIRKEPLDKVFIDNIKSHFGIDLVTELNNIDKASPQFSVDFLTAEVFRLHNLLEEVLLKSAQDKDKVIELQDQIAKLKEVIGKQG